MKHISRHFALLIPCLISSCAMSEEMKRIDESKLADQKRQASMSNDLNGEQIFFRTCNECHAGGKANVGPALDKLDEHFPDDSKLIAFIRKGKGVMPPVPKDVLNDNEMASLITYLRKLDVK
jgi:mono/diheme cytochrome c family protein